MKSYLFKRWDGSQEPFSLKKKDIVDKFMENIMKGMNPNQSLAEMMWDGFDMAGTSFRVMGLEEMLQEIQKQKQELFSQYNLEKAFELLTAIPEPTSFALAGFGLVLLALVRRRRRATT